ncbi:MAG TPA: M24 family metallopeptidase [Bacteroidetes bacterium]|nr:M24 family metallopeptidase [Bacteroidota bacterium]
MKIRFFLLIPVFLFIFLIGRSQIDLNGPLTSAYAMLRRADLRAKLPPQSCAVIFSGGYDQFSRSGIVPRRFSPSPNFFYLTGLEIPDGVLLIFSEPQKLEDGEYQEILFVPDQSDLALRYTGDAYAGEFGKQTGGWVLRPASQWRKYCIETLGLGNLNRILALPLEPANFRKPGELAYADLGSILFENLSPGFAFAPAAQRFYQQIKQVDSAGVHALILKVNAYLDYFPGIPRDPVLDAFTHVDGPRALGKVQAQVAAIKVDLILLDQIMAEMRQVKTQRELKILRKSADILSDAVRVAAAAVAAGSKEYQVAAEAASVLGKSGAELAMPLRVASGPRSALPYYNRNRETIPQSGFVVVDFAAKLDGYCTRLSRTLPAGGKFSAGQKQIYDMLLSIHQTALAECKPGAKPSTIANKALPGFDTFFSKLALATNRSGKSKVVRSVNISPIGLDLNELPNPSSLAVGMVLELETAIYIPGNSRINAKWRNTGIVLRDVIEITASGPVVLTKGVGWTTAKVETMMGGTGK